jgi:hypothetical protein
MACGLSTNLAFVVDRYGMLEIALSSATSARGRHGAVVTISDGRIAPEANESVGLRIVGVATSPLLDLRPVFGDRIRVRAGNGERASHLASGSEVSEDKCCKCVDDRFAGGAIGFHDESIDKGARQDPKRTDSAGNGQP